MNRPSRRHRPALLPALCSLLCLGMLCGCATWNKEQGVENHWRGKDAMTFQKGVTTQSEVVAALGPPSQIIGLPDRIVLYYMRELTKGQGFILLLYNDFETRIQYDRAIFFFDLDGVLQDFSLSSEKIPGAKTK